MKRVVSIFLVVFMLLSTTPLSGFIGLDLPKLNASAYTTGSYGNLTYNEYDTYIEITKGDEAATEVVIPSKINNKPVTHISKTAFYAFNKLESVTIGDSVSSISANNFSNCPKLLKIEVSPDNPNFCSVDGVLFSKDKTELLDYPGGRAGEYNIPNTVVNITAEAFRGANITAVSFPDSVKSIGNSAFSSCYKLLSVTLPESLTLLDEYAFYSCQSIESVTIGNGLEVISSDAFNGCLKLSSITIPDSVKLIGHEAFNDTAYYNNKDNWENGVLYIGKNLIEADYEITGEYTIKSGTKSISDFAFSGCQIQGIVIPDSVETIGESAFNSCSALKSIIIPSSVTSIGTEAFDDCSAITAFNVSEKNAQYSSEDGVLFNKDKTTLISYPIGSAAERYIIPSTVLTIEKRAFYGCKALKSVCIGDGVTTISNSAFRDCTALADIILPVSLTLINSRAFNSCDSLTTVNYKGSEEQWAIITIESKNSALENATINYNFVCKHETTITIPGKAASCTETGFTVGEKCSVCGEVTTPQKELDKLDHSYTVYVSTIPSTCVTLGHKVMKCENCEATTNEAITEYAPHTWNAGVITTNATCHTKGVKTFTCAACNTTKTQEVAIDTSNHDGKTEVRNAASATCKAEGYTGDTYCLGCDTIIQNGKTIAKLEHTVVDVQGTPATCSETGLSDGKKCSECGTIIDPQIVTPTIGHDYVEVITKPTCTEGGYTTRTCKNCGHVIKDDETSATGHTPIPIDGDLATCTKAGSNGGEKCSVCQVVTKEPTVVPATGHTASDWTVEKAATTNDEGLEVKKCTICGEKLKERIIPKLKEDTSIEEPTSKKEEPTSKKDEPTSKKDEPTSKKDEPTTKKDEPTTKDYEPISDIPEEPSSIEEEPSSEPPITEPSYMLGDINGDGKITATDARLILRISARLEKLEDFPNAMQIADVNGDNKITAVDARKVLRVATRLDKFEA